MSAELDPEAVGLALVFMTERYLLDTVSRDAEIDPESGHTGWRLLSPHLGGVSK